MNLHRRQALLLACTSAAGLARAQTAGAASPTEVAAELPGARLQGSATLRFLGLRVYDSRLWVNNTGVSPDWVSAPFALELQYARTLQGELIAERSLAEMRRQGEIAAATAQRWRDHMKQVFPDVKDGDRITGINKPGQGARFFFNGKLRGEMPDTEFARWFFGIWLSPKTSEPAMRSALLGTGA
jgi:co-chaperonin GroES (HSP10)